MLGRFGADPHPGRREASAPRGRAPRRSAILVALALLASLAPATTTGALAADPQIPPAVDPGTPTFGGVPDPIPAPPAEFDPTRNMMAAIYAADTANGGDSFWLDRILERPFLDNSAGERNLLTRGRALYMYTHDPAVLGFAGRGTGANGGGGYAYRQPPTTSVVNLYTLTISDATLAETTSARVQHPSFFASRFTGGGLRVDERKFITYNDAAITELTITNTGSSPTTRTITARSPIATNASNDGTELTGTVPIRYGLTTIHPRLSGDGFTTAGSALTRSI